jgi:acyl-coenzyme A thioesterase PaaI-like protein
MKYDQLILDCTDVTLNPGSAELKGTIEATQGILGLVAGGSTVSEADEVGG